MAKVGDPMECNFCATLFHVLPKFYNTNRTGGESTSDLMRPHHDWLADKMSTNIHTWLFPYRVEGGRVQCPSGKRTPGSTYGKPNEIVMQCDFDSDFLCDIEDDNRFEAILSKYHSQSVLNNLMIKG